MSTETTAAPPTGAVGMARASVRALRTLATLRREGRTVATDAERVTLSGWSGWGPLAPMFAPKNRTWEEIATEVRDLLPAEDVATGEQGTYNAFFTPMPVVRAMWDLLTGLGFDGGRVLEPGCGSGRFMLAKPADTVVTGIDRDPTSAAIAALLNPGDTVLAERMQDARIGDGFAAAIGNVPFGDVRIFDPTAPNEVCGNLHNYMIWRAVNALAPGGIAVLLTSRYTMDSHDDDARKRLAELADLVGAVRLPNNALAEGGTSVVADIVVLRRRIPGDKPVDTPWITARYDDKLDTTINGWWSYGYDPGRNVLGTMDRSGTSQYGMTVRVVEPDGAPPLAERIGRVAEQFSERARTLGLRWRAADAFELPATGGELARKGWYQGSIRHHDGKVVRVDGGRLVGIFRPGKELLALMRLRDLAVSLVTLEADHSLPDERIEPVRRDCAAAYADYFRRFGALNRADTVAGAPDPETGLPTYTRHVPKMGGFRKDPDFQLVAALEVYDDDTKEATPAPILSARQNLPVVRPTSTDDPTEALAWSLDHLGGRVDLPYIAGLLRLDDASTAPDLLGDAIYLDPQTRVWLTAEEYLSGHVRDKLRVAKLAADVDESFARNVAALRTVLPKWLGPGEITANLGAPWIGPADVKRFIRDTLGSWVGVTRIEAIGQWELEVHTGAHDDPRAAHQYGTPDVSGYTLVQLALNGKVPVVRRETRVAGKTVQRKDADASLLASAKQQALRARFSEWVWEDAERTARLTKLYNERYNSLAPRKYTGNWIAVDGIAPSFVPYSHQREFVARALATPASLCGHPVGAGKTASMAMTVMKLRQARLARKPALVVPNHLIEQVSREFRQLFPAVRMLVAPSETIAADRRSFAARCATGDWDVIIMTHSAFDRLAVSPRTEIDYLQDMVDDLRTSIIAASPKGRMEGRMVKRVAKQADALVERITELRNRVKGYDVGVTWEQLGIDWVGIDEAHYYKNLAVPCRTEGFSVRPSKRATGLDMKLRWLARRGSGRYAALFTGTPVSNTMLELYVVLHYLMPDYMREIGMGSADPWAASFVQFVSSVDVTVDGGNFQMKTRPSLFVNAPELRMLLSQVADIRTEEQLGLPRPDVDVRTVVVQPTTVQQLISMSLVARAAAVAGKTRFEPGDDNMLAICGDGRRSATDPALAGYNDPERGKLHKVADEIVQVWREHPDELQIAFCDIGTPHDQKGPQTYGRLRRMLTDAGMDVRRIRFIHEAKTDAARAELFKDCRTGKVSVIIGSTDKLGVGTNIQTRVVAMHHIDAPFRPSDVKQRDGRGRRPGNRHSMVLVFRYVTERTFDAYMWQMLVRKLSFIEQVTSGNLDRTIEDVSSDELNSATAIKAAATGQPLLQEQHKVRSEVNRLTGLKRNHDASQRQMRHDIPIAKATADAADAEAAAWEAIAAAGGDLADGDGDRVAALAEHYRYQWKRDSAMVAGIKVRIGQWMTTGRDAEYHPEIILDGGGGEVTHAAFRHWTADQYAGQISQMIRAADFNAKVKRRTAEVKREQTARSEAMLGQMFADADALTAALARLDQIDAELAEAADKANADTDATGSVGLDLSMLDEYRIPEPDEDPELAFIAELTAAVEAELEAALQAVFEQAAAAN